MQSNQNPYEPPQASEAPGKKLERFSMAKSDKLGIATVIFCGALLAGLDWGTNGALGGVFIIFTPAIIFAMVTAWTYLAATRGTDMNNGLRWGIAIGLTIVVTPAAYVALAATCIPLSETAGHGFDLHGPASSSPDIKFKRLLVAGGIAFSLVSILGGLIFFVVGLLPLFQRKPPAQPVKYHD